MEIQILKSLEKTQLLSREQGLGCLEDFLSRVYTEAMKGSTARSNPRPRCHLAIFFTAEILFFPISCVFHAFLRNVHSDARSQRGWTVLKAYSVSTYDDLPALFSVLGLLKTRKSKNCEGFLFPVNASLRVLRIPWSATTLRSSPLLRCPLTPFSLSAAQHTQQLYHQDLCIRE